MQSLDFISSGPALNNDVEPLPENNQDRLATNDFSRLMQRALAPEPKESPHEMELRAERKNLPAKNSSRTENDPAVSTAKKNPTGQPTADGVALEKKKTEKTAADPTAPVVGGEIAPAGTPADPLPPLILPLPVAGVFVSPQTQADYLAATKVKSGLTAASVNQGAETATATTEAATKATVDSLVSENKKPLAAATEKQNIAADATKTATASEPLADALADLKKIISPADDKVATSEVTKMADVVKTSEKSGELGAAAVAAAAAEKNGTGVATVDLPMKKSANTNKVAGLDGKILPGSPAAAAREQVLPVAATGGPVRAAKDNSNEANINLALPATISAVDFSTTPGAMILPSLTDARMRSLERTQDLVAMHAVRLVEARTDSLQVVIKPDAGTELSLQLRQRDGFVEAEATLQKGDHQLMSQHWSELQQRLEQRGIKLAPLGGENNFSADSNGSYKQQQQEAARELEAQKASAFAEFAIAGRAVGATARLAVNLGGWESWA